MDRTILAYLTVDEDRAFEEADGPLPYLEREAGWMEQSGIHLDDAAIVDDDAEDRRNGIWFILLASHSSISQTAMSARLAMRNGGVADGV